MAIDPPVIAPVLVPGDVAYYRPVSDVTPFTNRSGATYQLVLETLRKFTTETLVQYLSDSFDQIDTQWVQNTDQIISGTNDALTEQATNVNGALSAQSQQVQAALDAAVQGLATGSVKITDPLVLAAFQATSSQTRAWLDSRYGAGALSDSNLLGILNPTAGSTTQSRDYLDNRYTVERRYVIVNQLPGFKGDGSADMSAILNNAVQSVPDGSYTNLVVLPSAFGKTTIRIDSTVNLDISRAMLICPVGGVQFDASRVTGVAIRVLASSAVPNNSGAGGPSLGPFRLIGPGRNTAGTTGILFSADSNTGQVRHIATRTVEIEEFSSGIAYGDNAYCISHYNLDVKGCDTGVSVPAAQNSGESLRHFGSTFQDCRNVLAVSNGNADLYFIGCSFDYFTGSVLILNTGTVTFTDCHVEASIVTAIYWWQIHGGNFTMRGGEVIGGGVYSAGTNPGTWAYSDADNSKGLLTLFEGVLFNNMISTTGFFASGSGLIIIVRSRNFGGSATNFQHSSAVDNLMSVNDFESGTGIYDMIYVASDTATIADANNTATSVVGSNINAAPSTDIKRNGTYSLKVNKVNGAGSNAAIEIAIPVTPGSLVGFSGWLARNATLSGTVSIYTYYASMVPKVNSPTQTRKGKNVAVGSRSFSTTTDLAVAATWYAIAGVTQLPRVPMWATHFIIQINLSAMGAGAIYLDDFTITSF